MIFLVIWIISGFIGMAVGSSKNRAGFGFAMGLLLGFIGWIIVAVMPEAPSESTELKSKYVCPACRKPIDPKASICAVCKTKVVPQE